MGLTYYWTGTNPNSDVQVRLEGKIVGKIKSVEGGFQYFPNKSKVGGEVFATIQLVQNSLEA